MRSPIKLAVVGAGLIGFRHIEAIKRVDEAILAAVVEPNPIQGIEAPVFASLNEMFDAIDVDGVILSTPTPMHVCGGLDCVNRGVPVLIEKPLGTNVDEARGLIKAAKRANVPVLVGHHRRYNPLIQAASEIINAGKLGDLRAAHVTCWFYKPDDYFEIAPWRKQKGAGPISVNLVHDIDILRSFLGNVVSVQAQMAPARRGYDNEDLAAAVLKFEQGTLCTISVSDSIVSPWSWELTASENPIYPSTGESAIWIGGSKGALSIPDMRLWQHDGEQSWWNPISATVSARPSSDPLINQINHFMSVIRQEVAPLISGEDGLQNLRVIEAIQRAAETEETVRLDLEVT